MGASADDKKNVQKTWGAVYKDWGTKNGEAFYASMFENQPAIRAKFDNPDLKLQSGKFGEMVKLWMEGLDTDATLQSSMSDFCGKHTAMGITDMTLFKVALQELSGFVDGIVKMSDAEKKSWGVVAEDILSLMKSKF